MYDLQGCCVRRTYACRLSNKYTTDEYFFAVISRSCITSRVRLQAGCGPLPRAKSEAKCTGGSGLMSNMFAAA